MKTAIFKSLALATLTAGAVLAAVPQQAEARVVVNLNTGGYAQPVPVPVQQCQGYTRTFVDGYGYQRSAQGTACLQPNGEWVVVSENLVPVYHPGYPDRAYYRDVPSYYVRPTIIYYNDRNTHWDDHRDNGPRGRHH